MDNLLSITTFIPALAALILAALLRGTDEAAQQPLLVGLASLALRSAKTSGGLRKAPSSRKSAVFRLSPPNGLASLALRFAKTSS